MNTPLAARFTARGVALSVLSLALGLLSACGGDSSSAQPIPAEIQKVFDKPLYSKTTWSLRVVDTDSGEVIHDLRSDQRMLVGSVRKLFSVGLALEEIGPDHRFRTPIHRVGNVDGAGVLTGNLVVVASGDLAMGGRTNPDGSFAITNFDHNEANSLGNAELSAPDPLAGFDALARQVRASGITQVAGDVVIDERLFEPFDFREEFNLSAMFVNDDVVDVTIGPAGAVDWRPRSAAFAVQSGLVVGPAGSAFTVKLEPEFPACFGTPGCTGHVSGSLPADVVPPLTGKFPLVRTFRIVQPAAYARTVLIEALARAGVTVSAAPVTPNPTNLLPASRTYPDATKVAELVSHPYSDYVRYIMKVSYNLGADMSLMYFGVNRNATTQQGALALERTVLNDRFGIASDAIHFEDGNGGGESAATGNAVAGFLTSMSRSANAALFRDAQPRLGMDGSLAFVSDFKNDPTLAGAAGQVWGKTGTYILPDPQGVSYEAQALAGYITTKTGRHLAFSLAANGIGPLPGIESVIPVFQDQGTVAAILWKLY